MAEPGQNPAVDAETRVPLLWAISIVFIGVSGTAVLLRLYTRQFVVRNIGIDDVTISIAMVLSVGVSITTILQAQSGLGLHTWMTTPEQNMTQLKTLFAAMIIYNLSQIITKISFLLQYRRIFTEERTRRTCLVLMLFLVAWGIAQSVLLGFTCIPVSLFLPKMESICVESLITWYLTSAMNIATDFMVFLTPMPAIRSLQLRRKQKIMVTGIFCLGFFTCAISIVRLFVLKQAINTTDPTWDNVPTSYWSVVELNTGILCACLPTLRPLIRKIAGHDLTGGSGSGRSGGSNSLSKQSGGGGGHPRRYLARPATATTTTASAMSPLGFTLEDIKRSSSQDGLKDDMEEEETTTAGRMVTMHYEPAEYERHTGNVSKLSTAIYGKRSARGELEVADEDGDGSWPGERAPQPHIRVTREITSSEILGVRSNGGPR